MVHMVFSEHRGHASEHEARVDVCQRPSWTGQLNRVHVRLALLEDDSKLQQQVIVPSGREVSNVDLLPGLRDSP